MRILLVTFILTFNTYLESSPQTPSKEIDIEKVIDYPIPHVVARFCKDHGVSQEEAKKYERELKRYLILACEYSDSNLPMLSTEVDNLWHTFLLFTKDYQKFCDEMLGIFVHHIPEIENIEQTIKQGEI
jgi:hypothetical protein